MFYLPERSPDLFLSTLKTSQLQKFVYFCFFFKDGCGFCQIYLRINVKGAIARNRNRLSPIPDQVIETMASKLEPPCPDAKTWETHSLTIESDALQDL